MSAKQVERQFRAALSEIGNSEDDPERWTLYTSLVELALAVQELEKKVHDLDGWVKSQPREVHRT
jgi:hypothetical protein